MEPRALCGQMSSIYIFDDALTAADIRGIFGLGPSYVHGFRPTDDLGSALEGGKFATEGAGLFDGHLTSSIWLSYNANACDGRQCFDTTPDVGKKADGMHAALLGETVATGTQACVTRKFKDILAAMGGIKLLFPLFVQVPSQCLFCSLVAAFP